MDKNFENQLNSTMELFKKRDYEGALESFKQLLEMDNKNAHLYNNIGLCYAHLGQNNIAEEYYKKALLRGKEVRTYCCNLDSLTMDNCSI